MQKVIYSIQYEDMLPFLYKYVFIEKLKVIPNLTFVAEIMTFHIPIKKLKLIQDIDPFQCINFIGDLGHV